MDAGHRVNPYEAAAGSLQLESIPKISNFQCIDVCQSIATLHIDMI